MPAEILKSTPPPDDAGASTADRYDWQAAMATADVLALYLDCLEADGTVRAAAGFEVICEHHEDWALSDADVAEIVSAKHRETGVGAFTTFRSLLVDGGVLHLYDRWLALDKAPRCRLVTTAGLASEAHTLTEIAAAFAQGMQDGPEHDEVVTKLTVALARARALQAGTSHTAPAVTVAAASVDGEERARFVEFLRILRIEHSRPSRDHVALVAPGGYALPVAERLAAPEAAEAIWSAVHGLVRERMRAAGPRRRGHLPTVLGGADEAGFESRTVTLGDVTVAVRVAVANQSGFGPLPRPIRTSRLAIKMTAGGCSDNAVARAEILRRQYRQHWREVQGDSDRGADPPTRRERVVAGG